MSFAVFPLQHERLIEKTGEESHGAGEDGHSYDLDQSMGKTFKGCARQ